MLSLRGLTNKAVSVLCALVLLVTVSPAKTTHPAKKKSASKAHVTKTATRSHKSAASKTKKGKRSKTARRHGQQAIDSDRTREIQEALIREHYLDGEPTGVWDQKTKDALVRLQEENGWQTKVVPDSRALIKLGLGPSRDGLLNPDSAVLSGPHELGVEREIPGGAAPHR